MNSSFLGFVAFVVVGGALVGAAGCDDSPLAAETVLPGVGPIGAGGAVYLGGGGAGAGGTAGPGGEGGLGGQGGGGGEGGLGGAPGGQGGQGGAGGPTCEGGGKARVRLAHLRPQMTGKIEFCARSFDEPDFTSARRLIRELGDAEHDGLAYNQVSRGFELTGGVQLKVIDAADADCTGEGSATIDLCLKDQQDLSVVLLEGSSVTLPNAPATDGNRLRFVHAYVGEGPLDVGLVDAGEVLEPLVFKAIPYGQTSAAGTDELTGFAILDSGYLDFPLDYDSVAQVGAAVTGTKPALLTADFDLTVKGRVMTTYGTGKKGDAAFPPRALLCVENQEQGALTACTLL